MTAKDEAFYPASFKQMPHLNINCSSSSTQKLSECCTCCLQNLLCAWNFLTSEPGRSAQTGFLQAGIDPYEPYALIDLNVRYKETELRGVCLRAKPQTVYEHDSIIITFREADNCQWVLHSVGITCTVCLL